MRTHPNGPTSPLSVLIKPAGPDCNLACTYCFYKPLLNSLYSEAPRHRMTIEIFEALVEQFTPLAGPVASYAWQGGEPTLMGLDFYEAAMRAEQNHARPGQQIVNALQTNGVLLTERWGPFLRENRFLVGLSLDGPAELHDHHRVTEADTPTYDRVLGAARMLDRHEVEFNILVVLTQRSAGKARTIQRFLNRHGFAHVQYIPCVERDPMSGEPAPYSVSPEAYGQFLCDLFDIWSADWPPRSFIRELDEWLAVHAGFEHPSCVFSDHCGSYVVVEHNGDVFCCDFAVEPGSFLGNIMEKPLAEMVASDKFQAFSARHGQLGPECQSCEYLKLCHGGCPQHRVRFGDDHRQPTYLCRGLKQFFRRSESRYQGMARRWRRERQDVLSGS